MDVDVERLELAEPFEVLPRGVEVARAARDGRERPQRVGGEPPQGVALDHRPVGVGLVGEEVAGIESEGALEALAGEHHAPGGEVVEPGADLILEVVGVDVDVAAVDRVAALDVQYERRGLARCALGLEPRAQRVHEVAHAAKDAAVGAGPDRLGDLLAADDAVALGEQVLEQLAGALLEPATADRALAALHARAAEGVDPQPGAGRPVRLGPPPAVAQVARAQLDEHPRAVGVQRGGGHPRGAHRRGGGQVQPDLREGPALLGRHLREADVLERAWTAAAEQLAG